MTSDNNQPTVAVDSVDSVLRDLNGTLSRLNNLADHKQAEADVSKDRIAETGKQLKLYRKAVVSAFTELASDIMRELKECYTQTTQGYREFRDCALGNKQVQVKAYKDAMSEADRAKRIVKRVNKLVK